MGNRKPHRMLTYERVIALSRSQRLVTLGESTRTNDSIGVP
jgi:hypothetical protein